MKRSEEYRSKAAQCLKAAEHINDVVAKVALLDMAQAWRDLADKAHRKRRHAEPQRGSRPALDRTY